MIEAVCKKCYNNISQQDCGSKCNGCLIKRGNSKIPIFIYAFHMENCALLHSVHFKAWNKCVGKGACKGL